MAGKRVTLAKDPTQDDTDTYGRLLRYVTVGGSDFAVTMLRRGEARQLTSTYSPIQRHAAYRAAQRKAQKAAVGLWKVC